MKKILLISSGLALLLVAIIIFCLYALFSSTVTDEKGVTYYLPPGHSKKLVSEELVQQGVIRHPTVLSLYIAIHKHAQLKTGEYHFPKGTTLASIWHQITTGTGLVYHPFTIVPGWTFKQLRAALTQADNLRHVAVKLDDQQIMAHLGSSASPEGQFYPETYYYTRGLPDFVILKRAYDYMQLKLEEAWQERASDLPYKDKYEALIVASLIEKEAYLDTERPIISGVIVNRLRKNMLLQIDPTVIYGMGDSYAGSIHKVDLQQNTPYNTYVNKGLPPTPIAIPGHVSLEAAMHPQQNDYYYFVAKGDGSHQFSASLKEHNVAVDASIAKNHR